MTCTPDILCRLLVKKMKKNWSKLQRYLNWKLWRRYKNFLEMHYTMTMRKQKTVARKIRTRWGQKSPSKKLGREIKCKGLRIEGMVYEKCKEWSHTSTSWRRSIPVVIDIVSWHEGTILKAQNSLQGRDQTRCLEQAVDFLLCCRPRHIEDAVSDAPVGQRDADRETIQLSL